MAYAIIGIHDPWFNAQFLAVELFSLLLIFEARWKLLDIAGHIFNRVTGVTFVSGRHVLRIELAETSDVTRIGNRR